MKKKIVVGAFLLLILISAIVFMVQAYATYRYEMANSDVLEGMGALMVLGVGGLVVVYELDLFYTVYYFLFKPRTNVHSVLHVSANAMLLMMAFTDPIAHVLYNHVSPIFGEELILLFAEIGVYTVLRGCCVVIPAAEKSEY